MNKKNIPATPALSLLKMLWRCRCGTRFEKLTDENFGQCQCGCKGDPVYSPEYFYMTDTCADMLDEMDENYSERFKELSQLNAKPALIRAELEKAKANFSILGTTLSTPGVPTRVAKATFDVGMRHLDAALYSFTKSKESTKSMTAPTQNPPAEKTKERDALEAVLNVAPGLYYSVKCYHCGWVGSSEFCHSAGDVVSCPCCFSSVGDDDPEVCDVGGFLNKKVPEMLRLKESRIADLTAMLVRCSQMFLTDDIYPDTRDDIIELLGIEPPKA